ncbi:hypothetical protein [Halopiger goleimassiliensis]|uniref:hypothetical protein n=1 Tax=Halopiger goleimassiliensis TaxID=1293048 RepID=UPI000678292C|nr:hypothetical protein [Halopiger goleimassiliensis]
MPETEQQDQSLSELVVKEAVEMGLDSPLRDSILEAVDESGARPSGRRLPLIGAAFGLGAALGFAVGQSSGEIETPSLEDVQEPEIIEDVAEEAMEAKTEAEPEPTADEDSGRSLPRLILALGAIGVAAVLVRRQLSGGEEEEWEPIEEFEPATSGEEEEEASDESDEDEEELEAEDDEMTEE